MTETKGAGLGCARCGDCCEDIVITLGSAGFTAIVSTAGGMSTGRVQRDGGRLLAAAGRYMRDAVFIRTHMEPTGDVVRVSGDGWSEVRQIWRCLKFDADERTCTAHDDRPLMCSNYPWYGGEPTGTAINPRFTGCSYWLDVPAADRPAGTRPLIPLGVVTSSAGAPTADRPVRH